MIAADSMYLAIVDSDLETCARVNENDVSAAIHLSDDGPMDYEGYDACLKMAAALTDILHAAGYLPEEKKLEIVTGRL